MIDTEYSWIDDAVTVTDREAVCMARYMMEYEGLFLGSSSCVNLVAIAKYRRKLCSKEVKFATILCDAGYRHLTKFWSDEYLVKNGIFESIEDLKSEKFKQSLADLSFVQ